MTFTPVDADLRTRRDNLNLALRDLGFTQRESNREWYKWYLTFPGALNLDVRVPTEWMMEYSGFDTAQAYLDVAEVTIQPLLAIREKAIMRERDRGLREAEEARTEITFRHPRSPWTGVR